ncbi:MAG: hypothetical protein A3F18_08150 [Legionellales bacterium RIFCSPHIGHO2_12_FULL_37_14]|nr:MAG: hypothetical protein A3F18_08150 [Legionellales bacterium RIFCSPHIGHO2_12_FULL_37_14]
MKALLTVMLIMLLFFSNIVKADGFTIVNDTNERIEVGFYPDTAIHQVKSGCMFVDYIGCAVAANPGERRMVTMGYLEDEPWFQASFLTKENYLCIAIFNRVAIRGDSKNYRIKYHGFPITACDNIKISQDPVYPDADASFFNTRNGGLYNGYPYVVISQKTALLQ